MTILPGAHPDVMSLPKLFANYTSYDQIRFKDNQMNIIVLNMPSKVDLFWRDGANFTQGLPSHYTHYKLVLSDSVILSVGDYSNMFNWTKMTSFDVRDSRNFAYALSRRVAEMKSLPLNHLKLKLQILSHEEIQVKPFLEQLPRLVSLKLDTGDLTSEQVALFLEIQEVPSNFSVEVKRNIVEFARKFN